MKMRFPNHSLALLLVASATTLALPAAAASPTAGPKPAPRATTAPRPAPKPEPPPPSNPQGAAGINLSNFSGFDHIAAPKIQYNFTSGEYRFPERFNASRSGTDITADTATGNSKKKVMHATGHVIVHQNAPLKSGGDVSKVTQEPSTLTCDKLDADGNAKTYVATGNVHFTQANREGTSDTGTLNDATHMLHMEGHVHLRDKDQLLDADVVDYNTETGESNMSGKPVLIRLPIETPTPGPQKTPAPKKRRIL
jgi:lipopolysaccharide export system protein LptA